MGLALATTAWSAESPTPVAALPQAEEASTLRYFNRQVFTFRGSLSGISAQDRAKRATLRLREQLDSDGPRRVSQKPDALGVLLQIDGATTFVVSAADVGMAIVVDDKDRARIKLYRGTVGGDAGCSIGILASKEDDNAG